MDGGSLLILIVGVCLAVYVLKKWESARHEERTRKVYERMRSQFLPQEYIIFSVQGAIKGEPALLALTTLRLSLLAYDGAFSHDLQLSSISSVRVMKKSSDTRLLLTGPGVTIAFDVANFEQADAFAREVKVRLFTNTQAT